MIVKMIGKLTWQTNFLRINGEQRKLRYGQRSDKLIGGQQDAKSGLEVDGTTRSVRSTHVDTLSELKSARQHGHRFGRTGQHVAGAQFKAGQAVGTKVVRDFCGRKKIKKKNI